MSDHAAALRGLPRWHPDASVQEALHRIRRYGWAVTAVSQVCSCDSEGCDRPNAAWAYTSGLLLHDIPELLVYGLDVFTSGAVLNELGDLLHRCDWQSLVDAEIEIGLTSLDVRVRLIEVVDKDAMTVTDELFPDSPALQVVWPDDHGTYPWNEEEYTLDPIHQPIKGVLPDPSTRIAGPRLISYSTGGHRMERRRRRWHPTAG